MTAADTERGCPPGQDKAASNATNNTTLARAALLLLLSDDRHAHHVGRLLQDALTSASAAGWVRRAQAFADAAPRYGEFTGQETAQETTERRNRCFAAALACRRHAELLAQQDPEPVGADVADYLAGVAS